MIDKQKHIQFFKDILTDFYPLVIERDYGSNGVSALRSVLNSIQEIYKHINVRVFESITILEYSEHSHISSLPGSRHFTQFRSLTQVSGKSISIQIISGEECYVVAEELDLNQVLPLAFVYQKKQNEETIVTKSTTIKLPSIPDADSFFAINTFKSLDEAIEYYQTSIVKPGICPILSQAFLNPRKLFFKPGPEHTLRDSMIFCLKIRLRGNPEIRPEQNVDSSHPVDIKVSWMEANHIALIEIKWLGKSINDSGCMVTYTDARARSGATQLAEYLDSNFKEVPTHTTRGYLVVFDLRRRNPTNDRTAISREDGYHYESREITYDPAYHEERTDFNVPIRMFINPVCN